MVNQSIDVNKDEDTLDAVDVVAVDYADNGKFEISPDGALTFKEAPNYEAAAADNSATGDNEYNVVVQASDGATMEEQLNWFKVTVTVTDVEEEGSVKLRPGSGTATGLDSTVLRQTQVGVPITAHDLTDPDVLSTSPTPPEYQWYRSSSMTAMGTKIKDADEMTYAPKDEAGDSDIGSYLRVVATYTDGRGGGKTATEVSEYATIGKISNNTTPEFPTATTARAVLEDMPKGTLIGSPVTATDGDGVEKLTYWLSGMVDDEKFAIDPRTGQLKVKDELDFETPVGGTSDESNDYIVTVSAADSSDLSASDANGTATTTVTITVTGVDEKPTFLAGALTIEHVEDATAIDTNLSTVAVDAATYTATDPEGGSVTLSLMGDDAAQFELNDPDTPADGSMVLSFKSKPDFEMPGDRNQNNLYRVMVVASDGENSAMRDVTVKVTNMEEVGEIEVTPVQPRVGTELMAELTDSDGVVSGPTWQWYRQMVAGTCATATEWEPTDDPDMHEIEDATAETYTPVSKDDDYCLRVKAEYVDGFYDADDMFDKSMESVLSGKVQGPRRTWRRSLMAQRQ